MNKFTASFLALGLATSISAQDSLTISIGIRETGAGGGAPFQGIGADGGTTGGIEWINLDAQTIPVDGSSVTLTWDMINDPVSAFAGSTANGALEGTYGVLEHIRIVNTSGILDPIDLSIDDVTNSFTDANGRMQTVNFSDFEGFLDEDEVMFQEPSFSGSTAGNVVTQPPSRSGIDNYSAALGSSSYLSSWQFVDGTTTRWVRLTSFSTSQPVGNPQIDFNGTLSITFRAGRKQATIGTPAVGNVIAEVFGEGLNAGDTSTFYLSGADSMVPGAFVISLAGGTDVPFFGGTLYSFTSFLSSVPISVDGSGAFQLPAPGTATQSSFVFQGVTLNLNAPGGVGVSFSNGVQADYGI